MPTYVEKADIIRSEFDVRAPKLRLSVFAYLVEAGIKPEGLATVDEFMELLAHVTEYVSRDVDDYADAVAELEPAVTVSEVSLLDDIEGDNPYGNSSGDGGYR